MSIRRTQRAEGPPRRRRRWLWWAAALSLVSAGLVLAAWAGWRAYAPLLARDRIEAALAEALDRPVRIERVILRPWLGRVALASVTIAAGPTWEGEPMLRLGRAEVVVGISSVWRRQVVLSRILLEDVALHIVAGPGAAGPLPPLVVPERVEAGPIGVRIREVQVRRAGIRYEDPEAGRALEVRGLDATVRPGGGGMDLTVRAEGVRLRAPGIGEALERIEAEGRILPDLLTIRRASARWHGREVALGGDVRQPFGASELALAVRGEMDLTLLAPRAGLAWPVRGVAQAEAEVQGGLEAPRFLARVAVPELIAGPVAARQVALRGQWADGTLRLTEVAAHVFGGELKGTAAVTPARLADTRATVRLHKVSLAALEALAPTPVGLQGTLSLDADLAGDPRRLDGLRGRVTLDGSGIRLPGALQRAGPGTLRAEASLQDAVAELTRAVGRWPGVRITATGGLGLEGPRALRLGVEADLGSVGPLWGMEQIAGQAVLQAEANGSWTRPVIAGRVRAPALTVLEARLDQVDVPFRFRANALRMDDAGATLGESRLTVSGTSVWGGGDGGVGQLARPDPEVRIEVRAPSVRLEDLERWVPPAWRGSGRFALMASLEGTPSAWRGAGLVEAARLMVPRDVPIQDLRASFILLPDRIEIGSLRARAGDVPVRGQGEWAWNGAGRVAAEVGPADLAKVPGLPAALALRGTGQGHLEGEVRAGDVTASGRLLLEETGAVGVALGPGSIQLALQGGQMKADVAFPQGGLSAAAEGRLGGDTPIAGRVAVQDLPVGPLLRHFRGADAPDVKGTVTARARFTTSLADPLAGRATVGVEPARLTVAGEEWAIPDPVTLRWEVRALHLEGLRLESRLGSFTAAGSVTEAGALGGSVRGRFPLALLPTLRPEIRAAAGVLELDATVGGTTAAPTLAGQGSIADASLALRDFPEALQDVGARFRVSESRLHLLEAVASFGGEVVRASGDLALQGRQAVAADLTLEGLPVRPLARYFFPAAEGEVVDLEGVVSARGRFTVPLGDPGAARGTVDLHPVRLVVAGEEWASREPVALRVEPGTLHVERLSLHAPDASVAASGLVGLPGKLDLAVRGDLPLALVSALLPEVRDAGGSLHLTATVAGTTAAPAISGEGKISKGLLQLRDYPDALRDLEARFALSPSGLRLLEATGSLGRGTVQASGDLALDGLQVGLYRFTLTARDLPVNPMAGLETSWDFDLELAGAGNRAQLTGEGRLLRGLYTRDLTLLSVILGGGGGPATGGGGGPTVLLRVLLRFDNDLVVQTPLARLRVGGAISLEGSTAAPILFGRLDVREGQILFKKHRFTLTSASARFTDPRRIDPILDVVGTGRIRIYDVTLRLSGRGEDLLIRLSSTPPLPQEDLLALLTLGATREELGRSGAGIVAKEAAGLLVQEMFGGDTGGVGLDVFEVESTGDGPGTLRVGKDVTERLRLIYSQGLSDSGQRRIRVEYKVIGPLLVAGEQDFGGGVGADVILRLRFR